MESIERPINASDTESNRVELFVIRFGFGLWSFYVNEIKDQNLNKKAL